MIIYFLAFNLAVSILIEAIQIGDTRLSFSPLIGGPSWLRAHCVASCDKIGLEMDFVPLQFNDAKLPYNMVTGVSVAGKVRVLKCNPEIKILANEIKNAFKADLNLYSNNCFHFAYFFHKRIIDFDPDNNCR